MPTVYNTIMFASADLYGLARTARLLKGVTEHASDINRPFNVEHNKICTACGSDEPIHTMFWSCCRSGNPVCQPCLIECLKHLNTAHDVRTSSPYCMFYDRGKAAIYVKRAMAALWLSTFLPTATEDTRGVSCDLCYSLKGASCAIHYTTENISVYVCNTHLTCLQQSRAASDKVWFHQALQGAHYIMWALRESGHLCSDLVGLVSRFLALVARLDANKAALGERWLLVSP